MDSLYKLLYQIKEKPDLYFDGRKSLASLSHLIGGYLQRQSEIDGDSKPYCGYKFSRFQQFVQDKYNMKISQSWGNIINFHCASDNTAFNTFYKLLDEFLEETSNHESNLHKRENKMGIESLYKFLYLIKERPALFFGGRESIIFLGNIIDGYLLKQSEIDGDGKSYGKYDFSKFQQFVQNKYGITSSQSWDRIIDFYSSSNREAFEIFYTLLDEFLEKTSNYNENSQIKWD